MKIFVTKIVCYLSICIFQNKPVSIPRCDIFNCMENVFPLQWVRSYLTSHFYSEDVEWPDISPSFKVRESLEKQRFISSSFCPRLTFQSGNGNFKGMKTG